MSDDLSNFDEEKGWRLGATLQRFKAFPFQSSSGSKNFLLQLIQVKTPKEIHMQVTPDHSGLTVEVIFAYEPIMETEVRVLLLKIEEIYQEYLT